MKERKIFLIIIISFIMIVVSFSDYIINIKNESKDKDENTKQLSPNNLWIMNIDGTNNIQLTFNDLSEEYPSFNPGGNEILFTTSVNYSESANILNLATKERKKIIEDIAWPMYSRYNNDIIYIKNYDEIWYYSDNKTSIIKKIEDYGLLLYPQFSNCNTKIITQSFPMPNISGEYPNFDFTYVKPNITMILDIKNNTSEIIDTNSIFSATSFVPNSDFIIFEDDFIIWKYDLIKETKIALTNNKINYQPRVNYIGTKITYCSKLEFEDNWEIWIMDIDGNNKTQLTSNNNYVSLYPNFSPDGFNIVYSRSFIK